jgi:hypothetical protein
MNNIEKRFKKGIVNYIYIYIYIILNFIENKIQKIGKNIKE